MFLGASWSAHPMALLGVWLLQITAMVLCVVVLVRNPRTKT
jgi:hypothetical protein